MKKRVLLVLSHSVKSGKEKEIFRKLKSVGNKYTYNY